MANYGYVIKYPLSAKRDCGTCPHCIGIEKSPTGNASCDIEFCERDGERSFTPFGDEWRKELMKCSKDTIISMYRNSCIKNQELQAFKADVEKADNQYKEERLSNVIGWLNNHKELMHEAPEKSLINGGYIYPLLEKAKQELAEEKHKRRHEQIDSTKGFIAIEKLKLEGYLPSDFPNEYKDK